MVIKIKKIGLIERLVYILFYFLPFAFFISKTILNDVNIMGISLINFISNIIVLLVAIDSIISKKKYTNISHIWLFYLIFLALNILKILNQINGFSSFMEALPVRIYYYFIPLIFIMLKNEKLDLKKIANNLIKSTIIICPLSIYMFLTSNYFGTVEKQLLLIYHVVGTPFSRMFSIFGSPLVAGTFFVIIILLIIYDAELKSLSKKMLLLINAICLILTFSRTAFISLITVIILKSLYDNKIKIQNKFFRLISIIAVAIVIIIISINNGIYFWNAKDIFQNIRFKKWASALSIIEDNILFGSKFSIHISSLNTAETTLSDNSILLFLGYYGIILSIILLIIFIYQFARKEKKLKKTMKPVVVCILIFCLFYDFVQLFPSNYILVFLYIYTEYQFKQKKKKLNSEVDIS